MNPILWREKSGFMNRRKELQHHVRALDVGVTETERRNGGKHLICHGSGLYHLAFASTMQGSLMQAKGRAPANEEEIVIDLIREMDQLFISITNIFNNMETKPATYQRRRDQEMANEKCMRVLSQPPPTCLHCFSRWHNLVIGSFIMRFHNVQICILGPDQQLTMSTATNTTANHQHRYLHCWPDQHVEHTSTDYAMY